MWWQRPTDGFVEQTEVVVVGSGAGGAFAALTFAEAGLDVVLLEAGDAWMPADQSPYLAHAMSRKFEEGGFRTMAGRPPIALAAGRALGGSTVVNSAICFRTPEAVLAEWNERSGAAFEDTDGYYRTMDAVEAQMRVVATPDYLLSGLDKAHKEAAQALGWSEHNFRRNTPTCVGCGRCNQGCPVGGKLSVDLAVLPRAHRAGLRTYVRCQVDQVEAGRVGGYVLGEDGHPTGVGPRFEVQASRAVVLCGGAVGTPRLLLDSGLAAKAGEVGRDLMIHPVFSVMAYFEDRSIVERGSTQGHYVDEQADDDIVLESNPTVAGQPFQMLPFSGLEAKRVLARSHAFSARGVMIGARSTGGILPSRGLATRARYVLDSEDRQRALRGTEHACRLWLEGLGATFVCLPLYGLPVVRSMGEVQAALEAPIQPGRYVGYTSHPQATASVGRAIAHDGEVMEAPGVFAMDASALPSNVGRNPQISVMTVARLLAERLTERLGKTPAPLWEGPGEPPSIPQPGVPAGVRPAEPQGGGLPVIEGAD